MAFKKKKNKNKTKQVYEMGDLVLISKKRQGIIMFIGQIASRDGVWYGLELKDASKGENDGYMGRNRYFEPSVKGAGIFVKPKNIKKLLEKAKKHKPSPSPPPAPAAPMTSPKIIPNKNKYHQKSKTVTTKFIDIYARDQLSPSSRSIRSVSTDTPNYAPDGDMEYDDPMDFEPFRAPSQQIIPVQSHFETMLQKVPKKPNAHKNMSEEHKNGNEDHEILMIEEEIEKLNDSLMISNDSIIETKRIQIKQELNNMKPIELMQKFSEYLENNQLDAKTIQTLQKLITAHN